MRILIVKTSAIGDIIHAFPVVEYLKSRFPDAVIDWVVEKNYQELVQAHPHISTVLTIATQRWKKGLHRLLTWKEIWCFRKEIRRQKYDILFDLQGNTKSAVVTAFAHAQEKVGFAFNSVPERLNLLATTCRYNTPKGINIQKAYLNLVQSHFKDSSLFKIQGSELCLTQEEKSLLTQLTSRESPRYLVAFASRWPNKQLSEEVLKKFLEMIHQKENPYFYFVWGSEKEREQAERLQAYFQRSVVLQRLSLPLLQGVMRQMDLVISVDSMALHLSGKTPSFSIFGPSLASVYKPLGDEHTHFQGSCPYGRVFAKRCPVLRTCPTGACLKNVTAEALFKEYQKRARFV